MGRERGTLLGWKINQFPVDPDWENKQVGSVPSRSGNGGIVRFAVIENLQTLRQVDRIGMVRGPQRKRKKSERHDQDNPEAMRARRYSAGVRS